MHSYLCLLVLNSLSFLIWSFLIKFFFKTQCVTLSPNKSLFFSQLFVFYQLLSVAFFGC